MNKTEREILFAQICNSIGFGVNPKQASILLGIVDLIELKGKSVNFDDIELLVKPHIESKNIEEENNN